MKPTAPFHTRIGDPNLESHEVATLPWPGGAKLAGLWFGLLATMVGAASAQSITERDFLEELPVVLSASRIPQSLAMTPGAVTVLDRDFIRASGYRDVPSLLKLVPGFLVATERGGYSHVTYHGLGNAYNNRMQVLIDGRSVYTPYHLGGVDWFAVPLTIDEIERIEAFRGSNSTTYGSNAFMGVVNIITRDAGERPGTELGFSLGSDRLGDLMLRHERRAGELAWRVSAEVRYDRGLPNNIDMTRKGVVTLRGDYRISARDELELGLGVNDSRRGLGFEGTALNSNGLRPIRATNSFAHARWRRTLGPGADLQAGYYRNDEHATDEFNGFIPLLPPFFLAPVTVPIDFNRRASRDNLEIQHRFSPAANLRVAWGAEVRRDAVRSRRIFFSTATMTQRLARAYANAEWQPRAALTLNAGAMFERYADDRTRVAPRLFANWQVRPGHTLRLGQSIAHRAPSLAEEKADIRIYPGGYSGFPLLRISYAGFAGIEPERIAASEVGYVGQFRTWEATFDLRAYRETLAGMIQEVRGFPPPTPQSVAFCKVAPAYVPPQPALMPGTFTFCNSGIPARFRGLEWHLSARPAQGAQLKLSYSHTRAVMPFAAIHEKAAPRHSVSATWIQDWSARWSSTLTAVHYSSYEWGSGSLEVHPYTAYDARIAYRHGDRARPVDFAVQFLNLGSPHTEFRPSALEHRGNPVPRVVLLSVRFAI